VGRGSGASSPVGRRNMGQQPSWLAQVLSMEVSLSASLMTGLPQLQEPASRAARRWGRLGSASALQQLPAAWAAVAGRAGAGRFAVCMPLPTGVLQAVPGPQLGRR
jgi:hypothetical protein